MGGLLRGISRSGWIESVGWISSAIAAWLMASGAGAWYPIWPAPVIGLAGFLIARGSHRQLVASSADLVTLGLVGVFSTPALPNVGLLALAVGFTGIGLWFDRLGGQIPTTLQLAVSRMTCFAILALGAVGTYVLAQPFLNAEGGDSPSRNGLFHMGVAPASLYLGERQTLETGAAAWLAEPPGSGGDQAAIVFHGADSAGSKQRSADVLQRALLEAGYIVLSVDHPGYGESPAPKPNAQVEDWDPLPTALAALERLDQALQVDRILVVGHSLGAVDALRLLGTRPDVTGAVLFGATLPEPPDDLSDYWYERFHTDRRLSYRLPRSQVVTIRSRFGDGLELLDALPEDHPPIVFARFEHEWENALGNQDVLYELLPGSKMVWDVPNSSHYFSSFSRYGLVFGDTRIARWLARQLADLSDRLVG